MANRVEIPIVVLADASPTSPVSGASAVVKDRSTGKEATVFADSGTTNNAITQPLSTDSTGKITGWLSRGAYEVIITPPGKTPYVEDLDVAPGSDGAVDSAWIASSAIESSKIKNEAVESSKIKDSAVTEDKVADGAITSRKLKPTMGAKTLFSDYTLTTSPVSLNVVVEALEPKPSVNSNLLIWSYWHPEYTTLASGSYFEGFFELGGLETSVVFSPFLKTATNVSLPGVVSMPVRFFLEAGKKYPVKMVAKTHNGGDSGKLISNSTGFIYALFAA